LDEFFTTLVGGVVAAVYSLGRGIAKLEAHGGRASTTL
jgi:hypothetical protein